MKKVQLSDSNEKLFSEIRSLIDETRGRVAQTVNSALTFLYWQIGKRINEEVLQNERAEYGSQIVVILSRRLQEIYGKGFEEKNLRRMVKFASVFQDDRIVASLMRQLTWTHILELLPIKDSLQREFYTEMCRIERWSVRTLREKIDSMLYERTAISKKPEELVKRELTELRENDKITPDLIFRSPYILDFLGLEGAFSEKSLEEAILRELERFILELGQGFAFVERQKRMIIDGQDYKLDLLFFHRKLQCLVAIDLKIGKFKARYKSEMELYLRWLEKNEMESDENVPLGLILCAEGNHEQIELLQLDKSGIKVAEYITELPDKKMLQQKLHQVIEIEKKRVENILNN